MTRDQLEHAIRAAGAIAGDDDLYIVGSQAILGSYPNAPLALLQSMEVDIAPKNRPEQEQLIEGAIGELSIFHDTYGYFVDGIDLAALTLPLGWKDRVVVVQSANTRGVRGLCLHPSDLALSKLAAGREKDFAFVDVMLREKLIDKETLALRLRGMDLTPSISERIGQWIARDRA